MRICVRVCVRIFTYYKTVWLINMNVHLIRYLNRNICVIQSNLKRKIRETKNTRSNWRKEIKFDYNWFTMFDHKYYVHSCFCCFFSFYLKYRFVLVLVPATVHTILFTCALIYWRYEKALQRAFFLYIKIFLFEGFYSK